MAGARWKDWLTIPVRRLKWRLILSFVLVTLASMMMTASLGFIDDAVSDTQPTGR
jgi:hypothetical protein